jgi:hypothetical protein
MVRELLGKRQRLAHQMRDALAQRGVETLDMMASQEQLGKNVR